MTGFGDMIYERGIQQGRHEGNDSGGSHEWKNSRRSFEDVELASGRNKKSSGTADDCEQVVKVNYRYKINWELETLIKLIIKEAMHIIRA